MLVYVNYLNLSVISFCYVFTFETSCCHQSFTKESWGHHLKLSFDWERIVDVTRSWWRLLSCSTSCHDISRFLTTFYLSPSEPPQINYIKQWFISTEHDISFSEHQNNLTLKSSVNSRWIFLQNSFQYVTESRAFTIDHRHDDRRPNQQRTASVF